MLEKSEEENLRKIMARDDRIQKAIEDKIEKEDKKAMDRWAKAWAKDDQKELKRWEKEFARD
ncbi:unnamed protein product [marine sediment metagenome]|uniref:Uncharacterized protein n=1 Tax=marine sediment metagenome TaxID=412755 RepID=X1JHU1_9ZZZZ